MRTRADAPPRTADPAFAARFTLSLDGKDVGSFTEIGGLADFIQIRRVKKEFHNSSFAFTI